MYFGVVKKHIREPSNTSAVLIHTTHTPGRLGMGVKPSGHIFIMPACLVLAAHGYVPNFSSPPPPPPLIAPCIDRRPPPVERAFVSPAVEAELDELSSKMTRDLELACLVRNALPNTLDTTVRSQATGGNATSTFIITGDINAMWLRDSTNQVMPYLRFVKEDPKIAAMLAGVVRQQAQQVLADPYANAHYLTGTLTGTPNAHDDTTAPSPQCKASHGNTSYMGTRVNGMVPGIYERKFELDSLLAFLKLSRSLYEAVADENIAPPDPFSPYDDTWLKAIGLVLDTLDDQSKSSAEDAAGPCGPAYFFQRTNLRGQGPLDTLLKGVGAPAAYTGMVRSAFRPSDDACTYSFHIPANAMAVVELTHIAALLRALAPLKPASWSGRATNGTEALARRCDVLAARIRRGIAAHGVVHRPELGGSVYAYEVDGYGNALLMDDANVPSLLSLPYLGFVKATDPVYMRTRAYVLSNATNPWFFRGRAGEGVGGPHVGAGAIWPMAIIIRALTSADDGEIAVALATLKASAAIPNSWLIHESFSASNANRFTRPWFACEQCSS